jgi:hypothetical protein
VEAVEWRYDGLKGKIIPWTKERGGTSDDPSVLVFLLAPDGSLVERCPPASAYQASLFAKWLRERLDRYEREHPRTKVPFVRAAVTRSGDRATCPELEAARKEGKPVLLYLGRDARPGDDRKARAEVKAARAFEKKQLGSERTAEAAKGWALFRLDLGDPDHAAAARALGVEKAPSVLMFLPGEAPVDLSGKLRSGSLVYHLRKHAPK